MDRHAISIGVNLGTPLEFESSVREVAASSNI
jgi:hypothetical protein